MTKVMSLANAIAELDMWQQMLAGVGIPFSEWVKLQQIAKGSRSLSAVVPDGPGYTAFRQYPIEFDLYYEVFQDAFKGDGPLQWCGPILLDFFKRKGGIHQFDIHRDASLANIDGKIGSKMCEQHSSHSSQCISP